ncbi:TetR family transcriptional regulator [Zavarzinia sp. CC-PAN008]|uniref:TetR family transcriptional regulator n=1 Tax=Zavarzinia sp. CC-PAN008 TaxID=3243332 RepID=UPI003F744687
MARTRSPQYDTVRGTILARCAARFARDGYARTTIADLVVECAVSRGALYHYFTSKHEILQAILEGHVGELLAVLETVAAREMEPDTRLHALVAAALELYAGFRNEQVVLLNDLSALDLPVQRGIKALEVRIVELFAGAIDALPGAARGPQRKVDAMLLLGMMNYTYTWYDPGGVVSPASLAGRVADLFVAGLAARATA